MDSLTQAALGAAVGVAVMGRRTALWKSAFVGAICGTLPDLDSFIDYGDPVSNMTLHRGFSHSLLYLTLAAPLLAWWVEKALEAKQPDAPKRFRRWWLAIWLVLITHVLLDTMTVYGTQLALPFSNYPFGVGSIFIIDPIYSLVLALGLAFTLSRRAKFWNTLGLGFSSLYLVWSFGAQQYVTGIAEDTLAHQDRPVEDLLVTPAPFNTVLWRVLAMTPDGYLEGFYSFNDPDQAIEFQYFSRGNQLYRQLENHPGVARLARFSKGFFKLEERSGEILISDLRMGQEPHYAFNFVVAERQNGELNQIAARLEPDRPDLGPGLRWLWRRAWGEQLDFPRKEAPQQKQPQEIWP